MAGVNNVNEIINLLIKKNFRPCLLIKLIQRFGASSLSQIAFRLIFFRRQVCSTEQLFTPSAVTSLSAPLTPPLRMFPWRTKLRIVV